MEIPIHKYGNLTGTLKTSANGIVSSKKSQEKQDSNSFRGDSATLSIDAKLLTARASTAHVAFKEGDTVNLSWLADDIRALDLQ